MSGNSHPIECAKCKPKDLTFDSIQEAVDYVNYLNEEDKIIKELKKKRPD